MDVKRVTGEMNIPLLMALLIIMDWADWSLPDRLFAGFQVVDDIEASNVFRHINQEAHTSWKDLTEDGRMASENLGRRSEAMKKQDAEVFKQTENERKRRDLLRLHDRRRSNAQIGNQKMEGHASASHLAGVPQKVEGH